MIDTLRPAGFTSGTLQPAGYSDIHADALHNPISGKRQAMRLSVWRQFSSNHSAHYTVVGVFDSVEAAQGAAAKIQQLVRDITGWTEQNNPEHPVPLTVLSPAEESIARTSDINWLEAVDWLRHIHPHLRPPYPLAPNDAVIHAGKLAIVIPNGNQTWQNGHQFADLMAALGGRPYTAVFMGDPPGGDRSSDFRSIDFDYHIAAPESDAAQHILQALDTHMQLRRNREPWGSIPWIFYHPRYRLFTKDMPHEAFIVAERHWLAEHKTWLEYIAFHKDSQEHRGTWWESFSRQDSDLSYAIGSLRYDVTLTSIGELRREGNRIHMQQVHSSVAEALPALIGWTQALGCQVDYQLRES